MKGQVIWGAAGAACLIYGMIVRRIGSGTRFFLVWIALAAFAWLAAADCRLHLWVKIPGAVRAVGAGALILLLVLFAFTEARIATGFGSTGEDGLDYIIVLGAQVTARGPSTVLRYRLKTASSYLLENEKTICIVSGGQGYNEPAPEAAVMADYLMEAGVPGERILLEKDSMNTSENIANSLRFLSPETDRVGIVTNNFHIYRGTALARSAGIAHVSGIAAPSSGLYLPNNLLREFFGVLKDVLQGNMRF
ncbi:MAG: YdcF family protein [Eubacterium sp.]|nr:YdcF family protein [Eubacterium sp.]